MSQVCALYYSQGWGVRFPSLTLCKDMMGSLLSGKGSVNRARRRIGYCLSVCVCVCVSCPASPVYRNVTSELSTCIWFEGMLLLCPLTLFFWWHPWNFLGGHPEICYSAYWVPCCSCCCTVSCSLSAAPSLSCFDSWLTDLIPSLLLYSLCQTLLTVRSVHFITVMSGFREKMLSL